MKFFWIVNVILWAMLGVALGFGNLAHGQADPELKSCENTFKEWLADNNRENPDQMESEGGLIHFFIQKDDRVDVFIWASPSVTLPKLSPKQGFKLIEVKRTRCRNEEHNSTSTVLQFAVVPERI